MLVTAVMLNSPTLDDICRICLSSRTSRHKLKNDKIVHRQRKYIPTVIVVWFP